MTLRRPATWILAGLAGLAMMFANGHIARAGSVGITGTINPLPGHSPFLYSFELDLLSGSLAPGSSFTVDGLVGVSAAGFDGNPQSGTTEPPGNGTGTSGNFWVASNITTTGSPTLYASSVTWLYLGPTTFTFDPNHPANNVLGLFTVETIADFPDSSPPVAPGVSPIDYNYSVYSTPAGVGVTADTGGGSIILTAAVPEPASLFLLSVAAGTFTVYLRYGRRAREKQAL